MCIVRLGVDGFGFRKVGTKRGVEGWMISEFGRSWVGVFGFGVRDVVGYFGDGLEGFIKVEFCLFFSLVISFFVLYLAFVFFEGAFIRALIEVFFIVI